MPVTRGVDFVLNVKGDADRKIATLATASSAYAVAGKRAETTTAGFAKQIGGLKEATEKLQLGTLSRGVGMVQGAMASLATPTGAATVAIGGMALAGVAATAALTKLVTSAKAWHDELRLIGAAEGLISADQVRDLEQMDDALSGLGVELKRVAIIIATDFAPMLERAATKLLYLLQSSEKIIQATDWLKIFLATAGGPAILSAISAWDLFARVLEKVGIKAGQATDEIRDATREFGRFKTDNPNSFGDKVGGLAGVLDTVKGYVPKGSGVKPRDRSGDVSIDFGEEEAALEVEREQLKVAGEALAAHYRAQDALMKIGAGQEAMVATLKATSGGMIMSLVKGAIELATNMGDKLQEFKGWLLGLLPGIGEGIEKALTKVLPTLLSKLPKLIMGALNLPFVILRAIVNAVPALIQGLVAAFLKGIMRVLEFFKGGSDKNILTGGKEKFFGTSFKKGELSFLGFGNQYDRNTDGDRDDRAGRNRDRVRSILGSRMTGGYIERTGRYMLHAGERVVPPTGASTSAAMHAMRGGGGGKGATVNVSIGTAVGMDARELARWIRRELGDYGTGASLSPRGG